MRYTVQRAVPSAVRTGIHNAVLGSTVSATLPFPMHPPGANSRAGEMVFTCPGRAYAGAAAKQSTIFHVTLLRLLSPQQLAPAEVAAVQAAVDAAAVPLVGRRFTPRHMLCDYPQTTFSVVCCCGCCAASATCHAPFLHWRWGLTCPF